MGYRHVKSVKVTVSGQRPGKAVQRSIGLVVEHLLSNNIALALHLLYSDVISQLFGNGKYKPPK